MRQNVFFSNTSIGIDLGNIGPTVNDTGDLDGGGNEQLNHPVFLTAPLLVNDTLSLELFVDSDPLNVTYPLEIDIYLADGNGQGGSLLGTVQFLESDFVAGSLSVSIAVTGVSSFDQIVATTVDGSGNTSEFSATATVA